MDKETAKKYLFDMLKIRQFEEACGRMYMQGKIKGFLHLYIGEEAIAVGSISELSKDDYIITHYRDHGHALARGMDPNKAMAELYGKVDGTSRGKGGSMHLFDSDLNFMGGHAIVGGHLPIAVGIALGVAKLIFHLDLMMMLLPLYAIGIVMTFLSTEEFVNVAWDSAGVTTGPVTVPLVLAMGLGLGNAVSAVEGFGILSLASICPIVAVLTMGLVIQMTQKTKVTQES